MTRTVICPHCHFPQQFMKKPNDPPGAICCLNCGSPLPCGPECTSGPTTILCIDDDPLVLHFYREYLDRHGYRVLTATEGLPGIELARRERPDLILLDVMLQGLSGFDICRKLRADPAFRTIPIILITVWRDPSVVRTGHEAGATLTLLKPEDVQDILAAIREVLGETSGPPRDEPQPER
jgi:DNA-binding response OmpR family regulator